MKIITFLLFITFSFNVFSQNNPPVAISETGKAFSDVSTNIKLNITDQDGDSLTYTIITPPTNGTATIIDGVLTYTSSLGFTGFDTITFKANDGLSDSNEAQLQINVVEKEPNLNWATYFSSSQLVASKQDVSGNTYAAGRFTDFSNFMDNTTKDAVYPQGGFDGYISKYNDTGELQWVSTFGGEFNDVATDIAIASDGNIVVAGATIGTATFSDGEQLVNSSNTTSQIIIFKLNAITGDIIWKSTTDLNGYTSTINFRADNSLIGSVISNNDSDPLNFFNVNYLDGSFNIINLNGVSGIFRDLSFDDDDNVYITGFDDDEDFLFLNKYDSDFNLIWNLEFEGSGSELAYDSENNLIYLIGYITGTVNINPLGTEYNLIVDQNDGRRFFAAYTSSGIVEFSHVFSQISGDPGTVDEVILNIVDDKLLIYGSYIGSPDLDITDNIVLPSTNVNIFNRFASIYDLIDGPTLVGQYFFGQQNSNSSANKSEIILAGNDLLIATDRDKTMELFDINQTH